MEKQNVDQLMAMRAFTRVVETGSFTRAADSLNLPNATLSKLVKSLEAHLGVPRYPWRLRDGSLLHASADLAWWQILQHNPNYKVLALPIVIGNYHSHPSEQAEFREPDERPLLSTVGVSLT